MQNSSWTVTISMETYCISKGILMTKYLLYNEKYFINHALDFLSQQTQKAKNS